jgi:ankyrin repeat protein
MVRDSNQNTPLHAAAVNSRVEVTRVLLEHGADPWAAESSEWTPLNAAVTKKHEELVQILTRAMANPSQSYIAEMNSHQKHTLSSMKQSCLHPERARLTYGGRHTDGSLCTSTNPYFRC